MTPAFVVAYWNACGNHVHKGELDRSVSKSAVPTTTNMAGSRSFTHSGASSPSTTNVNTTPTAVSIATAEDSTPQMTDTAQHDYKSKEATIRPGSNIKHS